MLHTVNKSPFSSNVYKNCLRFASKGEPVLFYEDGVYAVQSGTSVSGEIQALLKTNPVYALSADIKARGIDKMLDGVKVVDYAGFVDLAAEHKQTAWL